MRFPKKPRSTDNFEDRTGHDYFRNVYSYPSSAYDLTKAEYDMKDAGWSEHDIYFLRAAQSEPDLSVRRGGTYFSGEDARVRKEIMLQRQFEKLMKSQLKSKR